ncbi:EAL domain-containing protein [Kitasatospora sp. GP82]|uniref:putative bifunctional diguanylate cyclase/phosphodiesterase n=1 Tax=Kitasatospora sp. GP82 TaxID=3035089 RepID=UPI0024738BEC|nr:EAL domain-containing protein [Kitasatospora sp. GP82]MDH6128712.1 diguanylate cyclase (GGDEF)-like protein/PAS domain S-box-containing protein [Kitasatospora sp. GP82]
MNSTDAVLPAPPVDGGPDGGAHGGRGSDGRTHGGGEGIEDPRSGRLPGALLVTVCLGYALGAALGWGSHQLASFMGDFGLAGAALAAALSCLLYGCTAGGPSRPAWLLFGLSSLMIAIGNGTWGWYEVVLLRTSVPRDSLAEYAFLLFAPLAIIGVAVLAQRPRTAAGWLCLLLDGWLVAGSLFTLSWSLALGRVAAGEGDDPVRLALRLAYPVLDILLVSLVLGLRNRGRDGNRAAVHTALVGLAVTVVCDALFTSPELQSSYHSGELLDAGWFAGSVLLAWAPWSPDRSRPSREHPSAGGAPRRRVATTFSALTPYVAAAVCTSGIVYNALGGRPLDPVMIVSACTVGFALLLRQAVMLLDNLSLAQELAQKEAHFRSLVQGSSDVIMIADANGVLSYVSPATLTVYSRDPEELVGGNLLNLVHPHDVDRVLAGMRRLMGQHPGRRGADGGAAEPSARMECRVRSGDGHWLHVESTVNRYRDGMILNSRDVTERVILQAQLHHNAFHDPLTDLPNRALFSQQVRAALGERSGEHPGDRPGERPGEGAREHPDTDESTVAVLFLDLDGFKAVNDTSGHQVGDELLVQAARRLQGAVRAGDTVARFGGDEFAALVCGRLGHAQVQDLAERVRAALSEPYWIGGAELGVAASIGIAFGRRGQAPAAGTAETDPKAATDELMRNADLAMYRAKSEGKGRVVLYTPAMRAELERRAELEERLRLAVREGSFTLLHQPVVDLVTGVVTAVEAQARWRSAQGLVLTPAEFLRTAERGDAATRFAHWMLQEAVTAAAARRAAAGGPRAVPVPVTVRLSAERLCAPGIYETIVSVLRETGLPAEQLVIELARTGPDGEADELGRRLAALRHHGVSTAVAGFGAGGGSLGALARLPFDALKLDRSLVQDLADSTLTRVLAGHALRLGRDLGLVTTAEGVDQPRQISVLQELGCRLGQGLAFAQPLDEHRLRRALARRVYPLPRPVGPPSGRRAYLAADTRSGGREPAGEGVPPAGGRGRVVHHHTVSDLPDRRALPGSCAGPNGGPHSETAVPPT